MPTPRPTRWRTSTRSNGAQNCVEVGRVGYGAAVRDTKDRAAGYLTASGGAWRSFLAAVKSGTFDGPTS